MNCTQTELRRMLIGPLIDPTRLGDKSRLLSAPVENSSGETRRRVWSPRADEAVLVSPG